jgi:hypothetical protein
MAANFTRKNPLAAIAAFQRAFPRSGAMSAFLLLRCPDASNYPAGEEALKRAAHDDDRIRILNRAAAPLMMFYQAIDVYLSLHRSEGYGLQLVEALQVGADVVATGWSIGDDISKRPGFHPVRSTQTPVRDPQGVYAAVPDATWAEPNIADAAALLTQCARERKS